MLIKIKHLLKHDFQVSKTLYYFLEQFYLSQKLLRSDITKKKLSKEVYKRKISKLFIFKCIIQERFKYNRLLRFLFLKINAFVYHSVYLIYLCELKKTIFGELILTLGYYYY